VGSCSSASRRLFGRSGLATTLIVVLTSGFFASIHYPEQGLAGAEQATVTGLVFATVFAVTGRLWTGMAAHAVYDLTAVAMIYLDLESTVAHFVFLSFENHDLNCMKRAAHLPVRTMNIITRLRRQTCIRRFHETRTSTQLSLPGAGDLRSADRDATSGPGARVGDRQPDQRSRLP
jgi:hypothetical protein